MPPEKEESCANCIHCRICEVWYENEMQNASNYIENCFEPGIMRDLSEDDYRILKDYTDLKHRKEKD